jgi:hypothetical protein
MEVIAGKLKRSALFFGSFRLLQRMYRQNAVYLSDFLLGEKKLDFY